MVRAWTSCRVQTSFHVPSVTLEWAATDLLQWLQALGAQEMQWAQALDKGPWLQMYTVPGNCMPLGRQTTEGSPSRTWQAGGGSFLLLHRWHALISRWLWTFNHNACENHLEELQGAATSSLFPQPLFQDTWPWVQLLCAEHNAPCQWDLGTEKAKPQTDLQCQAARQGEKALLVWTCGMLQWCSQDSLWQTGWWKAWAWEAQRWHDSSWQRGIAESGSFRLSTLMIDTPGDLVWDLSCLQQASYLEGGPLMWMLPLYLHVNQKFNDDDDDLNSLL